MITKDLPHYRVVDGETKIDLWEYFKTRRYDIGYDLKVLVCDGNSEAMEGAQRIYGASIGVQLCVRHFIETLKAIAREEGQKKRKETDNLVGSIWQSLAMKKETDRFFVPRYNNDAENLFKQLSLRLKSWDMFRSTTNAEHYLSAWALARRFTKFTDCRGDMNRLKNGKAPLELAGVSITGIDYLNL